MNNFILNVSCTEAYTCMFNPGGQVGAISAGVGVAIAIIVAAVVAFVYMKR